MEHEPIDPETALELYIAEKETAVADAKRVLTYESPSDFFLEWGEERAIENLNKLVPSLPKALLIEQSRRGAPIEHGRVDLDVF